MQHHHQSSQLHQSAEAHEQSHHVIAVKTYLMIYLALMLLLALTVGAYFLDMGSHQINLAVAMTIAVVKAVLIVLFFMHVYYSAPLTWITAVGSLLWVGLLLAFLLADYFSRGWLDILGK
ncbi:cytochrome C oxidase subunit IV family protein [Paludisphaera soli]|uniref:cytochrome C oxidase subunit IV family protein n=1 Tax=Paludisphaera soli TaxID=2712865 RepID=UPI0013ED0390|nr:cytochrome C oxidase subunit IV family protein [Paludisphaera soli]